MMQITIHMIEINNTQLYVYKYKHYIYFHAHIDRYISIKVNIIHIFHVNIHLLITFLHGRFVYIHTFFHYKMLCGCRMITCLYDIRQTSYERRLHHSHVAPSEPIWAEFAPTLGNIYPWTNRAATSQQSRHIRLRRATLLYICTYLPGKMMLL